MKKDQYFIIGITGGIGSGKTTATAIFHEFGIPVYNSDMRAKVIENENIDVKSQIISLLGKDSYRDDNLNKTYVAEKVFNDKYKLAELNSIVHPFVFNDFEEWKNKQSSKIVMKESALLIESGSYKDCNVIISIIVDKKIRIKRIIERDHLSKENIIKRINNQISDEERISKSNYIIYNNGDLADLRQEVKKTLSKIKLEYNS